MSRSKRQPREERRRDHVEINLLDESESRPSLARARRGCGLPFLGGALLLGFEAVRMALG